MKKEKDQKLRRRIRYLYVLMFADQSCYVGQTVSLKHREAQHRQTWNKKFKMYKLCKMKGTYQEAEEYEYAWRYKAFQQGLLVHGAPDYHVDPTRRLTDLRKWLSQRLTWPNHITPPQALHSGKKWLGRLVTLVTLGVLTYWVAKFYLGL